MITSGTSWTKTVADALHRAGSGVTQTGSSKWNLRLNNGLALKATARIEEGWLFLDAPLRIGKKRRPIKPARAWELLCCNAHVPCGCKFALSPDARSVHVRMEVPLVAEQGDIAERIRDVCRGFGLASEMFRSRKARQCTDSRDSLPDPHPSEGRQDLRALLTEADWPFVERSNGMIVNLDVPNALYQATVEQHDERGIRVAVGFVSGESWSEECRNALGVLLLTASGIVRMARAAAEERNGRTDVRFEAILEGPCCAPELGHALSALSAAYRLCGSESKALQDEVLAEEYLSVRGWFS